MAVCRGITVRNLTHKLVHRPRGVSELYDLEADPRELHNLWGTPAVRTLQGAMERELLDWLVETADVTPTPTDPRGPPRYPHAASACATSGADGPYMDMDALEAPGQDSLLAVNGVEGFDLVLAEGAT